MEEKISDFLKFAKEKGKIREVKEAFEKYPVEEEWHEGKIKNVLSIEEEQVNYSLYSRQSRRI